VNKTIYTIGGVVVKMDGSIDNKFRVLQMAMDNWRKNHFRLPMDSKAVKLYSNDLDRVYKLKDLFKFHRPNFIKKKHMIEVNNIFKRYNIKE